MFSSFVAAVSAALLFSFIAPASHAAPVSASVPAAEIALSSAPQPALALASAPDLEAGDPPLLPAPVPIPARPSLIDAVQDSDIPATLSSFLDFISIPLILLICLYPALKRRF